MPSRARVWSNSRSAFSTRSRERLFEGVPVRRGLVRADDAGQREKVPRGEIRRQTPFRRIFFPERRVSRRRLDVERGRPRPAGRVVRIRTSMWPRCATSATALRMAGSGAAYSSRSFTETSRKRWFTPRATTFASVPSGRVPAARPNPVMDFIRCSPPPRLRAPARKPAGRGGDDTTLRPRGGRRAGRAPRCGPRRGRRAGRPGARWRAGAR